jgi:hypothetical protein
VGKPAHSALLPFAQHQLELEGLRPLRLSLVQPIFIKWDALSTPRHQSQAASALFR